MKHKILFGQLFDVTAALESTESDWDIEVVSSSISNGSYMIIIKILRPKY